MASSISAGTTSSTALVATADTSGALQLATNNGTVAVTIDASQNVGIGTTGPGNKLDVRSSTTSVSRLQANGATSTSVFANSILAVAANGSGADATINFTDSVAYNSYIGAGSGSLYFATNGTTERMRIDSGGSVRIGTTTNATLGGEKVSIEGGPLGIKTTTAECMGLWSNRATGTYITFYATSSGTNTGSITTNGTTTTYATSSDYRLKNTVTPMTGALAKVVALKPVTYKWNSNGSTGEGFIAHELQEVVPDCVTGEKDAVDEDGNPVYQGIDTSFLVATLTAAIQELNAKVTALEAKVGASA